MNLLTRANLSIRNRFQCVGAIQQLAFYSTKPPDSIPKTVQLTRPKTKKASSFSGRIKEQTSALTVWPKPAGIPYEPKIANFVNLMGYVKAPVRFEAAADGKHFAAILISPENSGKDDSVLIPVVFEGDLAHVVSYHVKKNDCVCVSGQLSVEPLGFSVSGNVGRLHVVAENLNYVEGIEGSVLGNDIGQKIDRAALEKLEEVSKLLGNNDLNLIVQQLMDQLKSLPGAKNGDGNAKLNTDSEPVLLEEDESKVDEVGVKVGNGDKKSVKKVKGGEEMWRDLVINPKKWLDCRDHKANGLVKANFPDFRHKDTREGLWIDGAPQWVLPGLKKLEFDVMPLRSNLVQGSGDTGGAQGGWRAVGRTGGAQRGGGTGGKKIETKREDLWRELVENPYKWWDNRSGKRFPKAPDFKHKQTGEGLWLGSAPDWVKLKLPPLKDGKTAFNGKENQRAL